MIFGRGMSVPLVWLFPQINLAKCAGPHVYPALSLFLHLGAFGWQGAPHLHLIGSRQMEWPPG